MDQRDGGEEQREAQRSRAYHRGQRARALKEAGRVWLEPHYPVQDADLAMAWLDGWSDGGADSSPIGQGK